MIKETRIKIHSDKITNDIKLLVMSDIHYSGIKDIKKLEYVYEKTKNYDIDYICIPGDLIDVPNNEYGYLVKWLTKLGSICPVILSLGNHDIRKKEKEYQSYYDTNLWDKVSNIDNVFLLNNNCKSYKDIYFYGFTQSFNYYYEYKNENKDLMIKEIKEHKVCDKIPNKFSVLLMHSPICIDDKSINSELDKYDLVLCGHMHNGVVPPILDELFDNNIGLVAPNKKIFPKNARGIIKGKNIKVISSGITKISNSAGKLLKWLNIFFPMGINYIEISNENIEYKRSIKYYK